MLSPACLNLLQAHGVCALHTALLPRDPPKTVVMDLASVPLIAERLVMQSSTSITAFIADLLKPTRMSRTCPACSQGDSADNTDSTKTACNTGSSPNSDSEYCEQMDSVLIIVIRRGHLQMYNAFRHSIIFYKLIV
jgi:hypothetical protein